MWVEDFQDFCRQNFNEGAASIRSTPPSTFQPETCVCVGVCQRVGKLKFAFIFFADDTPQYPDRAVSFQ